MADFLQMAFLDALSWNKILKENGNILFKIPLNIVVQKGQMGLVVIIGSRMACRLYNSTKPLPELNDNFLSTAHWWNEI